MAIGAGALLHRQIASLLLQAERSQATALAVMGACTMAYMAWRIVQRRRVRHRLGQLPRVAAVELRQWLRHGHSMAVIDVRGSNSADRPIPGAHALALALSALDRVPLATWPQGTKFVTYCDCPNDASAARVAQLLAQRGVRAHVLSGGLTAWRDTEPSIAGPNLAMGP